MSNRTHDIHHIPVTWIIIANAKTATIYRLGKSDKIIPLNTSRKHPAFDDRIQLELTPVAGGAFLAESINDYQLGYAARGATVNRDNSRHNTYEPQGDIREEIKRRFVKTISQRLSQAFSDKSFDQIIIAAPAKLLGELKAQLSPRLQTCVAAVLSKDLAKYDTRVILNHLQDTFIEARVA